ELAGDGQADPPVATGDQCRAGHESGTSVRAGGRDKTLSERTAAYPSYRAVGERRRRTPAPPHLRMGAEWPRRRRQKRRQRKEQGKPSGRARRPTERGFKQAATAGRGTGRPVRRGISRSGGSNGRRRRGGAPAGRSGAAPRG